MEGDETAIISEEGGVSETPKNDEEVVDDQIDEISNSEESMDDEEEYIKASRYEFPLSKDNFIFDFKDVEPEDDDDENDNLDENEDNDEIVLLENGQADVEDLARTAFLLGMDTKTLCSEDCKGLCPVCGKNLNRGECTCLEKKVDPRMEILRKFFDD